MELTCESCGYRFTGSAVKGKCPYCGKSGSVVEAKSAESLVEEL